MKSCHRSPWLHLSPSQNKHLSRQNSKRFLSKAIIRNIKHTIKWFTGTRKQFSAPGVTKKENYIELFDTPWDLLHK